MKNLITCMTSGALRDTTIKLIGHADPRGTANYNEKLGLQRAEKVRAFLVGNGVDKARVQVASVGAEDAAPAPQEWAPIDGSRFSSFADRCWHSQSQGEPDSPRECASEEGRTERSRSPQKLRSFDCRSPLSR